MVGENVAGLVVGGGSLLIVRGGDRELGFGFPDFRVLVFSCFGESERRRSLLEEDFGMRWYVI